MQQTGTMHERKSTAQLLGREDTQISWPINVRKMGEDDNEGEIPFTDPDAILGQIGAQAAMRRNDTYRDPEDDQSGLAFT